MLDEQTVRIMHAVIRREGLSLLQYVGDAFPWTSAGREEALVRLRALIEAEREAVANLVRFLHRQRVAPPHLGSYPTAYTTLNFVALDHILRVLIADEEQTIAELQKDIPSANHTDARWQLESLLEFKKDNLEALRKLQDSVPESAATA